MKSSHQFLALVITATGCCARSHGFVSEMTVKNPLPSFVVGGRKHHRSHHTLQTLNVSTHLIEVAPTADSSLVPSTPTNRPLRRRVTASYDAVKQLVSLEQDTIGKVAGLTNFLSTLGLIGTGLVTRFSDIPQPLGPIHHLWVLSTIVLSVVSLKSAVKHRAKQPAVRNWIMGYSFMAICLSAMAEWVSPFAPAVVKNPVVSRAAFARLSGMVSLFSLKNLHQGKTLMENRKDHAWNVPRVVDYIAYVAPNAIGLVWSGYVAWFIGLRHSKHSYLNFLAAGAKTTSTTAAPCLAYYTCVVSTMCALYAPWIANLRDRKILSKKGEVVGNLALATVAWIINGVAFTQGLLPFPRLPKFLL